MQYAHLFFSNFISTVASQIYTLIIITSLASLNPYVSTTINYVTTHGWMVEESNPIIMAGVGGGINVMFCQ